MRTHEAFGPLLRRLRLDAGKTLDDIATALDLSVPYLSEVERGLRAPLTVDRIGHVASILDTEPGALHKAAAVTRGAFSLPAGPSPLHVDVAALLVEAWTSLSTCDLREIEARCEAAMKAGSR